jgi:hypothetical protein
MLTGGQPSRGWVVGILEGMGRGGGSTSASFPPMPSAKGVLSF